MNTSTAKYSPWERENIALAGVAHCASVVDRLAVHGSVNRHEIVSSLKPLWVLNPSSFRDIYPNIAELSYGFRTIQETFGDRTPKNESAALKYSLGLLHLRKGLVKSELLQTKIRTSLTEIEVLDSGRPIVEDERELSEGDEHIIKQLADLYQDTISTLSYRIQIQGKAEHLQNEKIANIIRAVLLSGIRSAVLWHQQGGRNWRLLVYRKRIHDTAERIRKSILN